MKILILLLIICAGARKSEELNMTILAPLDHKLGSSWIAALTEAEGKYRVFLQAMIHHSANSKLNMLKQFEISAYHTFNLVKGRTIYSMAELKSTVKAVGAAIGRTLAYGYYAAVELPKYEFDISFKLADVIEKLHLALLATSKIYPVFKN